MKTTSLFLRTLSATLLSLWTLSASSPALLVAWLGAGCTADAEQGSPAEAAETPQTPQTPITISGGFQTPESVIHDAAGDVYLVSNINGSPFGAADPGTGDGGAGHPGFVSRIRPDGQVEQLKWIDGAAEGVTLNAPKGMAIVGDLLYVTDVTVVRKFDRASGKPLGEIPIPGSTFLNDLTSDSEGTLYVSDTGLSAEGPTGTDAVYAISAGGDVRTLAKGKDLGQPNGLLADGDALLMVNWIGGSIYRLGTDGGLTRIAELPENQLDGIVLERAGSYLVSSWAGACVYRVTVDGEAVHVASVVPDLVQPADIGFDAQRGLLLIPFFQDNKVAVMALSR